MVIQPTPTDTALRAVLEPELAAFEREIVSSYLTLHLDQNHRLKTIARDIEAITMFRNFAGRPLWEWEQLHMARYGGWLHEREYALQTTFAKQGVIRRLLEHARDPGYPWYDRCLELTGCRIVQICNRSNTATHGCGAETSARRRLTDEELVRLFATVREQIISARCARDRLARQTHFAFLQTVLGFGLREHECAMGDVPDLSRAVTPEIFAYSPFEDFYVRFGKSFRGGPPTQRSVTATYVFRHSFEALHWYLQNVRPHLVKAGSPDAIFLNAHGARMRGDTMSAVFHHYRDLANLSPGLTLHCLRHTFATILREWGLELSIVSKLMGHLHDSTTLTYDHMGPDIVKQRLLDFKRALCQRSEQCRPLNGVFAP